MRPSLLPLAGLCALSLVTAAHADQGKPSPLALARPLAQYKIYVMRESDELVAGTRAFTDAVKAGRLDQAKSLYAPTRVHYERIEPVAELFGDLDPAIDSRADDHELKEQDPGFTGFHRLEYGLFAQDSTKGLAPFADKLVADVLTLQARIKALTVPPEKAVGGAAALLEEVAATKISGEEDRYSHSDLWDFKANVDGATKIVDLLRPQTRMADGALSGKIDANLGRVDDILAKYKRPEGGYAIYDKLSEADRRALQGPVTTLAEDLSMLRGTLGLD